MKRIAGWVLGVTLAAALPSAPARAQNVAAGSALYAQHCASCHNADPKNDPQRNRGGVRLGAGNAQNILDAIEFKVAAMSFLNAFLPLPGAADDIAAWLATIFGVTPHPSVATLPVIEYFHAGFGHYFVTFKADEIAKLDDGTFVGWARTGRSFKAWIAPAPERAFVCRFFTVAFPPKSSHFYTSNVDECARVKTNPDWTFEGEVFYALLPAADGSCAAGTQPVYRVYNQGQGGAPNHRYVTELELRADMLARGYVPEGAGIGVGLCAPQ